MRILVSGASGLIGGAWCDWARARGHDVLRLVRRPPSGPGEIEWNPAAGVLDRRFLEGMDAVLHLAGAGLGDERWTPARRVVLRESRVRPTALLAGTLARLGRPPRVLVSASAVGWYGDRGEELLDESSGPGAGFLATLGRAWEEAAAPPAAPGHRVVHPRTGLVLSPRGGALARMLPLFRAGLGGPLGNGRQWWSWITLEDLIAALMHAIEHTDVRGPFNAVSPRPSRCGDFARAMGAAVGRPAFLPAPAFALRMVLGRDFANEVLLAGQRARPAALERSGFRFAHPVLESALRHVVRGEAAA